MGKALDALKNINAELQKSEKEEAPEEREPCKLCGSKKPLTEHGECPGCLESIDPMDRTYVRKSDAPKAAAASYPEVKPAPLKKDAMPKAAPASYNEMKGVHKPIAQDSGHSMAGITGAGAKPGTADSKAAVKEHKQVLREIKQIAGEDRSGMGKSEMKPGQSYRQLKKDSLGIGSSLAPNIAPQAGQAAAPAAPASSGQTINQQIGNPFGKSVDMKQGPSSESKQPPKVEIKDNPEIRAHTDKLVSEHKAKHGEPKMPFIKPGQSYREIKKAEAYAKKGSSYSHVKKAEELEKGKLAEAAIAGSLATVSAMAGVNAVKDVGALNHALKERQAQVQMMHPKAAKAPAKPKSFAQVKKAEELEKAKVDEGKSDEEKAKARGERHRREAHSVVNAEGKPYKSHAAEGNRMRDIELGAPGREGDKVVGVRSKYQPDVSLNPNGFANVAEYRHGLKADIERQKKEGRQVGDPPAAYLESRHKRALENMKENSERHVNAMPKPNLPDAAPAAPAMDRNLAIGLALGGKQGAKMAMKKSDADLKGVHKPNKMAPGESRAGFSARYAAKNGGIAGMAAHMDARSEHKKVLSELKNMPKPKLDKSALPAKGQSFAQMKKAELGQKEMDFEGQTQLDAAQIIARAPGEKAKEVASVEKQKQVVGGSPRDPGLMKKSDDAAKAGPHMQSFREYKNENGE
jgi:hypothetical protein